MKPTVTRAAGEIQWIHEDASNSSRFCPFPYGYTRFGPLPYVYVCSGYQTLLSPKLPAGSIHVLYTKTSDVDFRLEIKPCAHPRRQRKQASPESIAIESQKTRALGDQACRWAEASYAVYPYDTSHVCGSGQKQAALNTVLQTSSASLSTCSFAALHDSGNETEEVMPCSGTH